MTGAAGFIGSHVADALLQRGHEVIAVDNLSTGRRENLPAAARFIEMDLASPELVQVVKDVAPTWWTITPPTRTSISR